MTHADGSPTGGRESPSVSQLPPAHPPIPWAARRVTYGLLTLILVAALLQVEAWPLTAYRLFSVVRASTGVTSELVALSAEGDRTPLRLDPENPVVRSTAHQYGDLPSAPPELQRARVLAWLDAAEIDPADVSAVRLERIVRTMDAETGVWVEKSRTVVVTVPLEVQP